MLYGEEEKGTNITTSDVSLNKYYYYYYHLRASNQVSDFMQRIGLSSCMSQSDWGSQPVQTSKDKKRMNENINPRLAKNKKELAPPTSNGKTKKNKPTIPAKKETIPPVNGKHEKPASQTKKKSPIDKRKDAPTLKPNKRNDAAFSTDVDKGEAPVITADDIKSNMSINVSDESLCELSLFFLIGYRMWDCNEHGIKRIGEQIVEVGM